MGVPFTFATFPAGNFPAADWDSVWSFVGNLGNLYCTATGTGNAIVLTPVATTIAVTAYQQGQKFTFLATASNSGATSLQVGALAVKTVYNAAGVAITAGIVSGTYYEVVYDPALNSAAGGFRIAASSASGGWGNVRNAKTALYTVANTDNGDTIALGGTAFYTLTFNAASGYDANFLVLVVNEDTTRGKTIAPSGLSSFILWPLQSAFVFNDNGTWQVIRQGRWRLAGAVTLNVDPVNGLDTNDGLATGAGNALLTLNGASNVIQQQFDVAGQSVTVLGTPTGAFTPLNVSGPYVGDTGNVTFVGNPDVTITNATNATPIVISAAGHAYANGDHVVISGVGGNTAANGAFKAASCNIGAGTFALTKEVDSSNVAGNGAYTSGGTVASPRKATIAASVLGQTAIQSVNGASINAKGFSVSNSVGQCVVADLAVINFTGKMDFGASGSGLPQIYATRNRGYIEIDDAFSISGATYGFVQATHGGEYRNTAPGYATANLTYATPVDPNTCFALASAVGQTVETANAAYNANGFTISCQAQFRTFEQGMMEAGGLSPPAAGFYPGTATGNLIKWANGTLGPQPYYIDGSGQLHIPIGTGTSGLIIEKNDNSVQFIAINNGGLGTFNLIYTVPTSTMTLVNGLNSNIATPATSRARITGPSGAFSVGGIAQFGDGGLMRLYNSTAQTMTIVNEDASSSVQNRIHTLTGGNVVLRANATSFATLSYDLTDLRWILESTN